MISDDTLLDAWMHSAIFAYAAHNYTHCSSLLKPLTPHSTREVSTMTPSPWSLHDKHHAKSTKTMPECRRLLTMERALLGT